jgi:hypothetical protein
MTPSGREETIAAFRACHGRLQRPVPTLAAAFAESERLAGLLVDPPLAMLSPFAVLDGRESSTGAHAAATPLPIGSSKGQARAATVAELDTLADAAIRAAMRSAPAPARAARGGAALQHGSVSAQPARDTDRPRIGSELIDRLLGEARESGKQSSASSHDGAVSPPAALEPGRASAGRGGRPVATAGAAVPRRPAGSRADGGAVPGRVGHGAPLPAGGRPDGDGHGAPLPGGGRPDGDDAELDRARKDAELDVGRELGTSHSTSVPTDAEGIGGGRPGARASLRRVAAILGGGRHARRARVGEGPFPASSGSFRGAEACVGDRDPAVPRDRGVLGRHGGPALEVGGRAVGPASDAVSGEDPIGAARPDPSGRERLWSVPITGDAGGEPPVGRALAASRAPDAGSYPTIARAGEEPAAHDQAGPGANPRGGSSLDQRAGDGASRFGLGLLTAEAPPSRAPLEPAELAALVNEALVEQARLHGVDIA